MGERRRYLDIAVEKYPHLVALQQEALDTVAEHLAAVRDRRHRGDCRLPPTANTTLVIGLDVDFLDRNRPDRERVADFWLPDDQIKLQLAYASGRKQEDF